MSLRKQHERTVEAQRDPLTLELGPDGGTFTGYQTTADLDANPDAIQDFYRLTGLDPDEWPLDKGSLRVSLWQQSKRTEDGDRDLVWLRSYRGNLRRATRPELDAGDIAAMLTIGRRHPRIRHKTATDATRVVIMSDPQVGKVDAGGGTPELLARIGQTLDLLGDAIAAAPTERAILLDPGDLVEGFESAPGAAFTSDLSHPEQLRAARGILTDAITSIAAQHDHVTVATCPSNHSAWRAGSRYLGRPGDDYGIDVHLSVQDALRRDPRYAHVEWAIPDVWDETTYLDAEGHTIALTHGHRSKSGRFYDWWKGQAASSGRAHAASIIVSGHYHNLHIGSLGLTTTGRDRTHIQAPALDGGSAWWRNISGEESRPGIVTFLLDQDGWRDLQLITP